MRVRGGERIRRERAGDQSAIHALVEAAFGQPDEANLVDRLRAADRGLLSLVAEKSDGLVGHILFTLVVIRNGAREMPAVGLAPVSVMPLHQRQGVGAALIEAGHRMLRDAGHRRVVLLGHPQYYPRFGYVPATHYGVKYERDAPEDAFMALALEPGAFQDCSGTACFAPEFYL